MKNQQNHELQKQGQFLHWLMRNCGQQSRTDFQKGGAGPNCVGQVLLCSGRRRKCFDSMDLPLWILDVLLDVLLDGVVHMVHSPWNTTATNESTLALYPIRPCAESKDRQCHYSTVHELLGHCGTRETTWFETNSSTTSTSYNNI